MKLLIKSKGENIEFLIDKKDTLKVEKYSWFFKNGYLYTSIWNSKTKKKHSLYLHRYIIGAQLKEYVDHINGNTLDNRSINLRICTQSENNINKKNRYAGVSFLSKKSKWRARIKKDGKEYHLGLFNTKEEALKVRVKTRKEFYPNFITQYD